MKMDSIVKEENNLDKKVEKNEKIIEAVDEKQDHAEGENDPDLKLDNFIEEHDIKDKKKTLLDLVEIAIRNKVENEYNGYCLCYEKTEMLLNDYCTIEDLKLPNGKAILYSMYKKIKGSLEQPEYKAFENGIARLSEVYKRIERMNFN